MICVQFITLLLNHLGEYLKDEQDRKRIETEIELPESEREHNNHDLSKSLDKKPVYPMVLLRKLTDDEIRTHASDMNIYRTEQQKSTATKKRKILLEKDLNPRKKLNNNSAKIAITSDSK